MGCKKSKADGKKSSHKFLKTVGLLGLLGGAAWYLSQKLAGDPDAGWVARTPADSYIADPIEDIVQAAQE
ncbi:MAG: hypothetical protein LBQ92_01140 [Propionibacteriaceae bacterium]|jgi:hypothetical protein|nr:hypothetical protein [Propionibacteriaceae bacterium]